MVGLFLASSLKFSKFDLIQQPLAEASPPRRCSMGWVRGGGYSDSMFSFSSSSTSRIVWPCCGCATYIGADVREGVKIEQPQLGYFAHEIIFVSKL